MSHVHIEARGDGISDLVIDRPKVNALSTEIVQQLRAAIAELSRDSELRGVLLRTEGPVYSAGLDLVELVEVDDPGQIERMISELESMLLELHTLSAPVATVIHGPAIAGGLVLSMCADRIVLSAADIRIGLTELQLGMPFPSAALEIVRATLPTSLLRRLIFDAELLNAEEAFVFGFGQQRVEDATQAARAWLTKTAARPLAAYRMAKAELRAPVVERSLARAKDCREQIVRTVLDPATREAMKRALGR